MRQPASNPHPHPTATTAASSFSVFRVPGSRYAASTSSNGSSLPLTVGPSLDHPDAPSGGRNSYTSTLPASPPYRASMPDMGLEDYDALDHGGIGWMRTGRVVRVKETGQSYRFPLDDEHLPQIELSRQDIVSLRETMETAIDRAVQHGGISWMENPTMAPTNAKYSWKVHVEKKNCIMYRRKNDPPLARHFLVRCKLDARVDDVMYGVMGDTTEDERTYLAHVHRDDFLDGAVLQLLARPTVEDPYQLFAVKWAACQSPMDSMFSIRDTFYVEYARTVVDAKGQKLVARVVQSINPRAFHAVEREFGFVRNDIQWVMLVRVLPGSNDTKTDVSLAGSVQFPNKANTPSWMANRFLSSMYSIVTGMATAGDAKFIVNHQLVTDKPWVPNHERSACSVCLKSFSLLRHRHHCRICAEIMCTSCTLELVLRTSMLPLSLRPEGGLVSTEKFCFTCVEQARRNRVIALAQELAIATHTQANDAAVDEEGDKENPSSGRYSEPFQYPYPYQQQPYQQQLQQQHQQYMDGGIPRAVSAESVPSSGLGWNGSHKVISTRHPQQQLAPPPPPLATTGPGSSDLIPLVPTTTAATYPRVRTHTAGPEGLYHDDARQPLRSVNSLPTVLDPTAVATELPRQPGDVVTATAIPSSFAKMEESIAAQQLLLRNMLMEGQKIMQQQQQYYTPSPPRPQPYAAIRASPQIDVLDDVDHVPPPPHLAPRPSDLM